MDRDTADDTTGGPATVSGLQVPAPARGPWPAPAKLNLFLHITGQRADGYHTLQTVFQFIDRADRLYFEVTDELVVRLVIDEWVLPVPSAGSAAPAASTLP